MTATEVERELNKYSSESDAQFLQRFFKTGKGQYGEGDIFVGVRMPSIRDVCRKFSNLSNSEIQKLLNSKIHEHRMAGVIFIANKFNKSNEKEKTNLFNLYLLNVENGNINNWDLIDVTTPHVVGEYLVDKPRDVIYQLAKSSSLWKRRVAVLSTFSFVKRGDYSDSLKIAEQLINDKEDLIHKAVGWMLREVGKSIDQKLLTNFLDDHAHELPRTMLRYSLEKLSPELKKHYMTLKNK